MLASPKKGSTQVGKACPRIHVTRRAHRPTVQPLRLARGERVVALASDCASAPYASAFTHLTRSSCVYHAGAAMSVLARRPAHRQARYAPEVAPPGLSSAVDAIKQMAMQNRRWGVKRIRDELAKLSLQVSRRTVRRYMKQARQSLSPQPAGQAWTTFLANHAHAV